MHVCDCKRLVCAAHRPRPQLPQLLHGQAGHTGRWLRDLARDDAQVRGARHLRFHWVSVVSSRCSVKNYHRIASILFTKKEIIRIDETQVFYFISFRLLTRKQTEVHYKN